MMWLLAANSVPNDVLGHASSGAAPDLAWLTLVAFAVGYWFRGVLTRIKG